MRFRAGHRSIRISDTEGACIDETDKHPPRRIDRHYATYRLPAEAVGCPSRFHRVRAALMPLARMLLVGESVMLLVARGDELPWAVAIIGVTGMIALWQVGTLAWRRLAEERQITPGIAERYRILHGLLARQESSVVPPDSDVLLLLLEGPTRRAVLRFDRQEFTSAMAVGIGETVVYERFLLSPLRPVVYHQYGTVTLPTGRADGRVLIAGTAASSRDDYEKVRELSRRTGADLATEADLDVLIAQLTSSLADRAH